MKPLAALLVSAAAIMNLAFTGLGSVFDYPDVLSRPGAEALSLFHERQNQVVALFVLLSIGAALMAPIALLVGRLSDSTTMRWAVRAGVAAAIVQVVGLLRWVVVVPLIDDVPTFDLLNDVLGTTIGEFGGYALTAAWTALVVTALAVPHWFRVTGLLAATLVATGVLATLGIGVFQLTNFVGYIVWSLWLLAFAALVTRVEAWQATSTTSS